MENLWLITAFIILQIFVEGFSSRAVAAPAAVDVLTPEPEIAQLMSHRLVAAAGDNVTLPCLLIGHDASNCYWMIDEDPIAFGGHYQLTGNRSEGDCTLRVYNFRLTDIGLWHCGLPRTDSQPAVKTGYIELAKDPQSGLSGVFWLHHLRHQDVLAGDSVALTCQPPTNASMCYWTRDGRVEVMRKRLTSTMDTGKPAMSKTAPPTGWQLDYYELDGWTGETEKDDINGVENLNVDCSLVLIVVSVEHQGFWQCVYEEASNGTLVRMPPVQLFVSARVSHLQVWSDNDDHQRPRSSHPNMRNGGVDRAGGGQQGGQGGQRLPVNPRGATTLHCSAQGSPSPHFRWEEWREEQWHVLNQQQNVTLPVNATGNYSCLAWNTLRGGNANATLRSTYIIIGMTDFGDELLEVDVVSESDDNRGGYSTVIAVSGALVLIALVLVVGLLCQRKRGSFALDEQRTF